MRKISFYYLWAGQSLANSGDIFYIVGIISVLYITTGSPILTTLVPFTVTFSRFFGGIIAPLIIDRLTLKKMLILSQLLKTIILLLLYILISTLDKFDLNIFSIFPIIALVAFLDGWATPARNALLPSLIPSDKLVRINSLFSMTDQIIQLGGWSIGAILVVIFGGEILILITLILFIISTILMWLIKENKINNQEKREKKSRLLSIKEGWMTVWNSLTLRTISFMDIFDSIAGVVWIAAIIYIYVEEVLNKSEAWWGYINSAYFFGVIVGGFICFKGEKLVKEHAYRSILISSILIGILTVSFGYTSIGWLALLTSSLVGVSSQIKFITQLTIIQTVTSKDMLAKVFSVRDVILTGTFGLSSLIFGLIADIFHIHIVFMISAFLIFISSLITFTMRKYLKSKQLINKL